MVEIGKPLVLTEEYPNAGHKDHFRRVNRFIRHGVDKFMEMTAKENFFVPTHPTHKKPLTVDSNFRRVAYFAASGLLRKEKRPFENKDYRHNTCFVSCGTLKGQGNVGGGTVANICDIGYNPEENFAEKRVKRQNVGQTCGKGEEPHYGIRKSKLRARKKRTSLEELWLQKQFTEATANIKDHEHRKLMKKKKAAEEKRKEYEALRNYNPWGQPAAGAPKVVDGRICMHLCDTTIKRSESDDKYDVLGLPKIVRETKTSDESKNWRRKRLVSLSNFEKTKVQKENERKDYYAKYLEKQRAEEKKKTESAKKEKAKFVPTDFLWGRTDVERTLSGRLIPRKRQLYQLDHGTIHKSYKTYFSIADKMARFPGHRPKRGEIDYHSYREWVSKGNRGAAAAVVASPSTSITANTSSGGGAEGCGKCNLLPTITKEPPTKLDAAVQYEVLTDM